jgi:hypothetical protein
MGILYSANDCVHARGFTASLCYTLLGIFLIFKRQVIGCQLVLVNQSILR